MKKIAPSKRSNRPSTQYVLVRIDFKNKEKEAEYTCTRFVSKEAEVCWYISKEIVQSAWVIEKTAGRSLHRQCRTKPVRVRFL